MRTTRWQGTTTGMGLEPRPFPVARTARGAARPRGYLAVGEYVAVLDLRRDLQHAPEEPARESPVDRSLELPQAALEVLLELASNRVEPRWRLEDPRRDHLCEPLEHRVERAVGVGHTHEPSRSCGHREWSEGRVDLRIGNLEQALGVSSLGQAREHLERGPSRGKLSCRLAQLAVDFAHVPNSSLRRFNPSWTLRRAASCEHSRASATSA